MFTGYWQNQRQNAETVIDGGSRFETIMLSQKKVRRLKQNLSRFCFKSWIFSGCFILFHKLDLTRICSATTSKRGVNDGLYFNS